MSVQRENIADKNDKNDDATNQVFNNMENYEEVDIHQSFQVLSEMYVRRTYISVACLGAPFLFVTKCLLRNTLMYADDQEQVDFYDDPNIVE